MRILLSLPLLAAFSLPSFGQTGCDDYPVFSCTIKGKFLEICVQSGLAIYSFGPELDPELELVVDLPDVEYTPWAGVGRAIYEEVVFRNQDYSYAVWTSNDRHILDDKNPEKETGGVIVSRGDKTLASLDCDPFSVSNGIDRLWQALSDAGQCYSRESFSWEPCTN